MTKNEKNELRALLAAGVLSVKVTPAALLTAKAMGISKQTIDIFFRLENGSFRFDEENFTSVEDCVIQMLDDGADPDKAVYFCSDLFSKHRSLDPKKVLVGRSSKVRRRVLATIKKDDLP